MRMELKKPLIAAIIVQITYSGMSILAKAAFASGMNNFIFIFYRQAFGTLFLIPPTIIFKRKEVACLSVGEMFKIFMLALLGRTLVLIAYGLGVKYTSAVSGAAAFNCLPVTTFLFALILRMEKLKVRKASGMAKVGGLMLCIGGVSVLAFYKGPLMKPLFNYHFLETHQKSDASSLQNTWALGCFLLLISSTSSGLWLVLQALVLKTCPSPLVLTCGQTLSSTFQTFVVAIAVETNPSQWRLGWNIRLLAVLYCGIFVICTGNYLACWVIKKKGPVFLAATTPLNLIATLIGSQFLLSDAISLGRQTVGTLVLLPPTIYFKRFTWGLNTYGLGVKYTSATLGAAAFNCVPVTTFFFALISRMEKVKIRKSSGMAKVGGMMLCIAGVAVLAFYKGPYFKPLFNFHLFQTHQSHVSSQKTWILGCFLLLVSTLSWGLWFVLQAWVLKTCPSPLVLTFGQTLSSAIQSFVVAIAIERNPSQWKLVWNICLIAILYCGIFVICIANYLSSWVVKKKGPVFQAVTTPFNLIFTLIGSEFLLNDGVSLGSIIGAMLLILSLYSVLWGKRKEMSCQDTENKTDSVSMEKEMLDHI
ncbi:WAT1-related protein At5g64700-like isoform X2 [Benincasa hispida]|uniref:WAT1-related protein At5g64700-like isoform X2 n=1 Tax=Benincasa hispida TaxID=102211 RepID=UPI001900AD46|nr:WAT1-related protein At5g64700-like isoform X2 [Benincasa hispida]